MTFASGEEFFKQDGFWVWCHSASKVCNADKVIVTHGMPNSVRDKVLEMGFHIFDVPLNKTPCILRDRHLAFWQYLNDHGHKYEHICICDSKDVVFQLNPFDWVDEWRDRFARIKGNKSFLEDFVILTSEGFKQSQSGFARIEDFEFQRDVPPQFLNENSDRWVINGGVTIGTPRALQNHEFMIWTVAMKTIGRCTDQASLNYLMYYLDEDATYSVSQPWNDTLCVHGEGVKEGFVKKPLLKDGLVVSPYLNEPYFIVHQWDRMDDDLREQILAHLPR